MGVNWKQYKLSGQETWLITWWFGSVTLFFSVILLMGYIDYLKKERSNNIVEETYWTDENIGFWSRLDIPQPSDPNNAMIVNMLHQMSLFKSEALTKEAKCVPKETTLELKDILTELIPSRDTIASLMDIIEPLSDKIYVKRCPTDVCDYAPGTKCLPLSDVRQRVKYIQVKPKPTSSSRLLLESILNGTAFCQKQNIIHLPVEEHVYCSCQCFLLRRKSVTFFTI